MISDENTDTSTHVATTRTVIPLHDEEVRIDRQSVLHGTVRVEVRTQSREQVIDELLARDRVDIERVPIGRMIETIPDIRQDGDITIIPVVEEVIITERRLILKEEIRLHRVRTTERHSDTVIVRTQTAEITRTTHDGAGLSAQRSMTPPTAEQSEESQ